MNWNNHIREIWKFCVYLFEWPQPSRAYIIKMQKTYWVNWLINRFTISNTFTVCTAPPPQRLFTQNEKPHLNTWFPSWWRLTRFINMLLSDRVEHKLHWLPISLVLVYIYYDMSSENHQVQTSCKCSLFWRLFHNQQKCVHILRTLLALLVIS